MKYISFYIIISFFFYSFANPVIPSFTVQQILSYTSCINVVLLSYKKLYHYCWVQIESIGTHVVLGTHVVVNVVLEYECTLLICQNCLM